MTSSQAHHAFKQAIQLFQEVDAWIDVAKYLHGTNWRSDLNLTLGEANEQQGNDNNNNNNEDDDDAAGDDAVTGNNAAAEDDAAAEGDAAIVIAMVEDRYD